MGTVGTEEVEHALEEERGYRLTTMDSRTDENSLLVEKLGALRASLIELGVIDMISRAFGLSFNGLIF